MGVFGKCLVLPVHCGTESCSLKAERIERFFRFGCRGFDYSPRDLKFVSSRR